MRVAVAIPEAHVSRPVLDAALESTTRLNESMMEQDEVPTFREAVEQVRWKPEPPGDEHFDHAKLVLGRGWGDCDDLAPWHAASLRATGEDPGATAFAKKSGPNRWHALVRRSDGSVDDPSIEAGMPTQGRGVLGAALPAMFHASAVVGGAYVRRPQLALRPLRGYGDTVEAWQARADLPWHWMPGESPADVAMASLHASPVSSQALVGACRGAVLLGEANDADEEDLDRLDAIADMLDGCDWDELAGIYGEEHADAAAHLVGSFFGRLKKGARSLARSAINPMRMARGVVRRVPGIGPPMAQAMQATDPMELLLRNPQLLSFMPGVGPIASAALMQASPALQRLIQEGGNVPPAGAPVPSFRYQPFG